MTPQEINYWAAFLIVGLPILVVLGGGLILHMAIALAALALFFSHPAIAIAIALVWFFPWRWFWAAFAVGEGLKFSGFASRLQRRRPRRRPYNDRAIRRQLEPPPPVEADPKIPGFTREQVRELRRRFPREFGDTSI